MTRPQRRSRNDYVPTVRADPRNRDNPKLTWVTMATDTNRASLLIPGNGKRVRVKRIKVMQDTSEGAALLLELYFGTGATAATTRGKVIDILRVPNGGETATRTFDALGKGPLGLVNESVSYRWRSAPTNAHIAIIEYEEE